MEIKKTDLTCKNCGRVIGKLNVSGTPIFETIKEGVVKYDGHYCNLLCQAIHDLKPWINCWGDFNKYSKCISGRKMTDYGLGYKQAMRDIHNKFKETSC